MYIFSGRITEIPESDVFICTSLYDELNRQIKKLPEGLKKFTHSSAVTEDEIYYFPKFISVPKVSTFYLMLTKCRLVRIDTKK